MKKLILSLILVSATTFAYDGRYWLYGGMELGYQTLGGITAPEVTKDGAQFGLKVGVAKYFTHFAADIDLGYRIDSLSGSNVNVSTKTFMSNLSFRYRLTDRFHIGPTLLILLGQDNSFSEAGTNSNDKPLAFFVGLKAMYDLPLGQDGDYLLRFGAQAVTDIDIASRQVTAIQGLAEFAIPLAGKKTEAKVVYRDRILPEVKVDLKEVGVRFETARSRLIVDSISPLEQMGEALAKHAEQYDRIFVAGHTDSRGAYLTNVKLSQARAKEVATVLEKMGVDPEKILVAGYGPDEPIDGRETASAYEKNRRVELKILGVTNVRSKELIELLENILNENRTPQGLVFGAN